MVAGEETGAEAYTAQALAFAHGFRWDTTASGHRLGVGEIDPDMGGCTGGRRTGRKSMFDLLVVDEAGMLPQDVAQALLHIADTAGARLVLVGDRPQLAAVGRGGVMEMALAWGPKFVEMDSVYRFRSPTAPWTPSTRTCRCSSAPGPSLSRYSTVRRKGRVVLHRTQQEMAENVAEETAARHLAGVRQSVSRRRTRPRKP